MSLSMSRAEREEFLAAVHVGVLSVVTGEGGAGPLTIPIWYLYEPGGVLSVGTGASTAKAIAIRQAGRFSLCVQDEAPPYKYVSVEGPAVIEAASADDRRAMARRYLGAEAGEAFVDGNPGGDNVIIRMTPEHWRTADFSHADG